MLFLITRPIFYAKITRYVDNCFILILKKYCVYNRYTFPTHGVVDMVYPTKNLAFRPNHVAQNAELLMATIFTNGSYLWVYDMNDDATFDRDIEGQNILENLFKIKKIATQYLMDYNFADEEGIVASNDGVMVKRFVNRNNQSILLGYRLNDKNCYLRLTFNAKMVKFVFANGKEKVAKIENDKVKLPKEKMFIALIQ